MNMILIEFGSFPGYTFSPLPPLPKEQDQGSFFVHQLNPISVIQLLQRSPASSWS